MTKECSWRDKYIYIDWYIVIPKRVGKWAKQKDTHDNKERYSTYKKSSNRSMRCALKWWWVIILSFPSSKRITNTHAATATWVLWRTSLEDSSIVKTVLQEYSGIQRQLHTDNKTTTTVFSNWKIYCNSSFTLTAPRRWNGLYSPTTTVLMALRPGGSSAQQLVFGLATGCM